MGSVGDKQGWVGSAGYLILLKEYISCFIFLQLRLTLNMIDLCESHTNAL